MQPHQLMGGGRTAERGVSPVTVNTYLRPIKCYFLWKELDWKLPWLKEEPKILQTLSPAQVKTLLQWRPKDVNEIPYWFAISSKSSYLK